MKTIIGDKKRFDNIISLGSSNNGIVTIIDEDTEEGNVTMDGVSVTMGGETVTMGGTP